MLFVVPERRGRKFAPRVVAERVVLRRAVSRRRTRERTPERVVGVIPQNDVRRSPAPDRDPRHQIAFVIPMYHHFFVPCTDKRQIPFPDLAEIDSLCLLGIKTNRSWRNQKNWQPQEPNL